MKFKFLNALLAGLILTTSNATYAGIIDYNDTVANSFKDTETGLVWLDSRMTGWSSSYSSRYNSSSNGESYTNDQNLTLNPDFRIASMDEVKNLMANAFTSISLDVNGEYTYRSYYSSGGTHPSAVADSLFSADRNVLNTAGFSHNYSHGYYYSGRDYSNSGSSYAIRGMYSMEGGGYGFLNISNDYAYSYSRGRWSSTTRRTHTSAIQYTQLSGVDHLTDTRPMFMVMKTVTVPEPSTLAIFALGMIGLASRRFKKQS